MTNYPANMTLRPLDGWPFDPTRNRRRALFSAGWGDTVAMLNRELRHLGGGRNAPSVLQVALTEADFRLDGMPRASANYTHPGVILNVEPTGAAPLSFPCDTFLHWHENFRAIALALEALRKIDRYGVTQTGQQYRGWQAIEATPTVDAKAAACAVLARIAWPNENDDCQASWAQRITTDPEIARNTLKQARIKAHPDRNGGSQALWNHVEGAAKVLGLA